MLGGEARQVTARRNSSCEPTPSTSDRNGSAARWVIPNALPAASASSSRPRSRGRSRRATRAARCIPAMSSRCRDGARRWSRCSNRRAMDCGKSTTRSPRAARRYRRRGRHEQGAARASAQGARAARGARRVLRRITRGGVLIAALPETIIDRGDVIRSSVRSRIRRAVERIGVDHAPPTRPTCSWSRPASSRAP